MKNPRPDKKPPPPLNDERLRGLALHYVGKYATTQAKLTTYLARKIRERGWSNERPPGIDALVRQFAELGYINDAQFAESRSRAFVRRGYGERRFERRFTGQRHWRPGRGPGQRIYGGKYLQRSRKLRPQEAFGAIR